MKPHNSSKPIALFIVSILGIIAIMALWMGYDLARYLIIHPTDTANLAVFVGLIGVVFSICTGAIGFVGGMLSATERQPIQGNPTFNAAGDNRVVAPGSTVPPPVEGGDTPPTPAPEPKEPQ